MPWAAVCVLYYFVYIILINIYIPGAIWHVKPMLAFEAYTDPVDTSAKAALAPHPTMEQEEFSDTTSW
jgi:hypothetical protein